MNGNILNYECAFAAEAAWKYQHAEKGEEVTGPPPFDRVAQTIDARIAEIMRVTEAKKNMFFFTGSTNFRNEIAFTQKYKERPGNKPFYYDAVRAYIERNYESHECEGLEADDLLGIMMTKYPGQFICCSRDKDLRQIPGWHYSWELNKQPQFGPVLIDEMGWIELTPKRKILGGGAKFFFSQMLMGDTVDTIPGIPNTGPVTAYNALKECQTYAECLEAVKVAYRAHYKLYWPEVMLEQGRLLWMVRELDAKKQPIMWSFDNT